MAKVQTRRSISLSRECYNALVREGEVRGEPHTRLAERWIRANLSMERNATDDTVLKRRHRTR